MKPPAPVTNTRLAIHNPLTFRGHYTLLINKRLIQHEHLYVQEAAQVLAEVYQALNLLAPSDTRFRRCRPPSWRSYWSCSPVSSGYGQVRTCRSPRPSDCPWAALERWGQTSCPG